MKWSKRAALATAPPLDTWPEFDYSRLSTEDKEFIEKRAQAVRMLVGRRTYKDIKATTGLSQNQVRKLAVTCLSRASDGRIMGFRGVLPFTRLSRNIRRNPILPKRENQHGGMSCSLQDTLARFPELQDDLVRQIRKQKKKGSIPEFKIKGATLHRIFIDELRKRGVTRDRWPFTTKYLGLRSIVDFMNEVLAENFAEAVAARGGKDAKAHLATGSGHQRIIPFSDPYDAVEIDAYHIDAFFTVSFRTPNGDEVEAVLSRLWLIAAVERVSTAVLAYRIVYRTEVTALDVAGVIRDAICTHWIPKDLTIEGLKYPVNGGFPSGVITEAKGALWTVTMLDGALAHLSNLIHDTLRKATGFVVNWGAPGHFERRPNVERTFRRVSEDVFLRFPSTTGSNPRSGRSDDPEGAARKYRIRADEVEQLLDVVFAEHNGLPGEGNFYNSPLETLRHFLSGPCPRTMVRKLPFSGTSRARLLLRRVTCTVRGGVKSGRRPYIQFEHVHYTNPVLSLSGRLVGTELVIYIDDEDLRTVKAFNSKGLELGILSAKSLWNRTKHDLATRKAIFQLVAKRILVLSETVDPVQAYLRHLARQMEKSRKNGDFPQKDATNLARVAKDADVTPTLLGSPRTMQELHAGQQDVKPRLLLVPPSGKKYKVKNR